jgi:hypothetical protein
MPKETRLHRLLLAVSPGAALREQLVRYKITQISSSASDGYIISWETRQFISNVVLMITNRVGINCPPSDLVPTTISLDETMSYSETFFTIFNAFKQSLLRKKATIQKRPSFTNISKEQKRGQKTEQRAEKFFNKLIERNIIQDCEQASPEEDVEMKIDFWILFQGKQVPIQIKSSSRGQRKHINAMRTVHKKKQVPSLIVRRDTWMLQKHVIEICMSYIRGEIKHL